MGIRIQPREVEIDQTDPFKNDLLNRREKAEVLTNLVSNIDGPCAMAVDAAWGAGKTTFLKMWARHLRNECFPVVEFNAWETDSSGDPFVALTTEMTEQLKVWTDSTVASRLRQTQFLAKKLLRRVAPGAIRTASGFIPIVGSEVGHALSSFASEAMTGYFEEKKSAAQFRSSLQGLANSLRESSGNKPTVVLIDELDRCRPSYAIELLETAKHIFGVDSVVFVLAVNRDQLAHSIKSLYGSEFGAEEYLRRFFDIDFRLPAPDRDAFIRDMLASTGVIEFLENARDQIAKKHSALVSETLISFLGRSTLTLRDVGQAVHRLSVVLASLANSEHIYSRTLTVLSIISAFDPLVYRKFVGREPDAEQTLEEIFGLVDDPALRQSASGALVEAVIIGATITREHFFVNIERHEEFKAKAPLFFKYSETALSSQMEAYPDQDGIHATNIIQTLRNFYNVSGRGNEPLGLEESVQSLELLAPEPKAL